jgi:hypothetical protein
MRQAVLFVLAALASGCAGGGSASTAAPAPAPATAPSGTPAATAQPARRGNSELIIEEEIKASGLRNALEVIQRVRPSMLRPRGSSTNQNVNADSYSQATSLSVVVYMDDIKLGEPSQLSNVGIENIKEIRFINARDATTKWGTGHTAGVIQVVSKNTGR